MTNTKKRTQVVISCSLCGGYDVQQLEKVSQWRNMNTSQVEQNNKQIEVLRPRFCADCISPVEVNKEYVTVARWREIMVLLSSKKRKPNNFSDFLNGDEEKEEEVSL